jgi:hypothetical protein
MRARYARAMLTPSHKGEAALIIVRIMIKKRASSATIYVTGIALAFALGLTAHPIARLAAAHG